MARRTAKPAQQPLKKTANNSASSERVTFTSHIRELRRRIISVILLALLVGGVIYYFHDFFMGVVLAPLGNQKLIYLTPAGGFSFVFMVTFYITILVVLPFLLYQVYAFLKPAIPTHKKSLSIKIALVALVLMIAGASFGYLFAVPGGLNFLGDFGAQYVTASLTADAYLRFLLGYVLGMGILFQLPLLLLFWHWIKPMTPKGLLNSERYIIVAAFVAAAIISPTPDALTQTIIAIPIIFVYQLGVVAVLISIKRAKKYSKKVAVPPKARPFAKVSELPAFKDIEMPPAPAAGMAKPMTLRANSIKKQPARSMDGFLASQQTVSPKPVVRTSLKPRVIDRPQTTVRKVVVPRRTRIISDFTPIRKSIVDENR